MTQFEWKENLMGKEILVQTVLLPQGIHIGIYGGDLPHIGAVSIADPEGTCMTTQFPGHKDGIISSRWVQELARKKLCPAVVEVGIHYDRISDEGIRKVIALSEKMLSTVLKVIERRKSTGTVLIDSFSCFWKSTGTVLIDSFSCFGTFWKSTGTVLIDSFSCFGTF